MPVLGDATVVTINDGASNAFVAIPNIIEFTPPVSETPGYDATAIDSPAGTLVKAPKSRAEPGMVTWKSFYLSTEYARFEGLRGTVKQVKITYPDTKVTTCDGWVSKVEKGQVQNQEPIDMTVTFMLTKVPTTV